MQATPKANLLTSVEAARHLGFSPRTLENWRLSGAGPAYLRVSARCVRYRQSDLDAWVQQKLRRSTSDPGGWDLGR
ncbi:MAG: helix-turn-helix domain-containing protein [Thermoanaerobaculia bacterium]|nr:helix-turn-helix domain-containing protein [Thermoanaerobaculia bacterium]